MPFTFSHPALVLPVHAVFKRWTSLTGLVVGSVTPDFEKFIRMASDDPYSHTWRSIFYYNLPLGLLLAFVFHLIVRDCLIGNLPGPLSARLGRFKHFDWAGYFRQHYLIVIISVLLGAASHIFWDSFTHRGGRAVGWLPFLLNHTHVFGYELHYFFILQLLSSLAGGVFILYVILRLPPDFPLSHRRRILPYWLTVAAVASAVVALKLLLGEQQGWDIIFILISAGLIGLIAAPFMLKKFMLRPYEK